MDDATHTRKPDRGPVIMTDGERRLVSALRDLEDAASLFRRAVYRADATLVVNNEAVNRLSASLKAARDAVAEFDASRRVEPAP
jgi:hypothetical protein